MLKAKAYSHPSRRQFLKAGAFGAAMPLFGGAFSRALAAVGDFVAPHEAGPHTRTWMAWPSSARIWGSGLAGIHDDHIDATSRFVRPGVVMIQVSPSSLDGPYAEDSRRQLQILSDATDAKGRRLKVIQIEAPVTTRVRSREFLNSYLNFYTVNGAVITAQFGDAARDSAARAALEQAFPGRKVEMLDLDRLYNGGGGVHCVTQHQPSV